MDIDLVVFDMAGTTVDDGDAVNRCLRDALARAEIAVSAEAVNAVMGLPKPEALRLLIERSGRGTPSAEMIAAIHSEFVASMIRFYAEDPAVAEYPGVRQIFGGLRRAGIKVAVNSGFSRAIARTIIDRLGWRSEIDGSVTSDEVARGRPHPEMIHKLMADFALLDTRRVAKVGDTPVDLEEGTNAACGRVIGVTWGTHTRAQLERWPHTDLVNSRDALARALGLTIDLVVEASREPVLQPRRGASQ